MPLGTKVGLGQGHVVLHGYPASPIRGTALPNFRPMSIVVNRSPISATAEYLLCICLDLASCVFFSFSLDCLILVLFAFVVQDLVSSVHRQEIG